VFGLASLAGFLAFRVLKSSPPESAMEDDPKRSASRVGRERLVAAVLAAGAAAAFFQGRAAAQDELLPTRTAKQISQDIKTAKEQLT
jgi:hypothetical protein